jgi:hypothetical protein
MIEDKIPQSVVDDLAFSVKSYVENAVSEMGYDDDPWLEGKIKDRYEAAKRRGVRDLSGWLGDEFYNDSGIVSDLAGDRICDVLSLGGYPKYTEAQYQQVAQRLQKLLPHITLNSHVLKS